MIADLGDGRPDGSILQRALSQVPAPQHGRVAVDTQLKRLRPLNGSVLILPAKGPSFDYAPVQRMRRRHFRNPQIERRLTFKFDAH